MMTWTSASARSLVMVLLCSAAAAAQQTPVRDNATPRIAPGTAIVSGHVVNDLTNRPIRRAVVTLSSADSLVRTAVVTDDNGAFAFTDLPAGRYFLGAGKAGAVSMSYGATRPGRPGTTIAIGADEKKTGVTLRLQPGAVLTGAVHNRSGEPVSGVRVIVLRSAFGYDTGERTLVSAAPGFGEGTDDRGIYRVFGLPPGDYYVVVVPGQPIRSGAELREITTAEVEWAARQLQGQGGPIAPGNSAVPPPAGPAVDYAPEFYPGVFGQANATAIALKAGEERDGVDIMVDMTPTAKITGSVVSPDGVLPPTLLVNVIAHDTIPGVPFSGFGNARVDASGKFTSAGLPPGDYMVTVRPGAPPRGRAGGAGAASAIFGTTTVTVSGTDVETTVTLERGVTITGRLVFDGSTLKPPADLSTVRVNLTPVRSKTPSLGVAAVTPDAAGNFTIAGVTPGHYHLQATAPGGWQLRSAIVQGRDSLDEACDITNADVRDAEIRFTDRPTEISGDLKDATGHPAPEYFIIVFPADQTYWTPQSRRIQSTRPGTDGHFQVKNLPPGEYRIAAVTDVEQGEWYDPAFLAQLVGASTKIVLAESETKVQNLKIAGGG